MSNSWECELKKVVQIPLLRNYLKHSELRVVIFGDLNYSVYLNFERQQNRFLFPISSKPYLTNKWYFLCAYL